jgi:hypothetical protein
MILICYDGSPDSRAAVEQAEELFADRPATVLTVWQPFAEMAARLSVGFTGHPAPGEARITRQSPPAGVTATLRARPTCLERHGRRRSHRL